MKLTERDARETGRDYALRMIKDNIIRLELAPGSLISENELAAEMGLSRTPVREALIELSKVKIIEVHPQKRSVVAPIDCDLVEEARFMRHILECEIIKLVCDMAEPEDIEALRENVSLQKFYLEKNYESLMSLDDAFHAKLYSIAKMPQIYDMMKNLSIHFDRARHLALVSVKNSRIVADHEALLALIEAKDKEGASDLIKKHLDRYKIDTSAIRETYPQYFKAEK